MPLVRDVAVDLAREGGIELRRRGERLAPDDLGAGPIRLAPVGIATTEG
jgi:hypothetical protein